MEISEERKTELFRRIMDWSDDSLDWLQFQLSVELQERDRYNEPDQDEPDRYGQEEFGEAVEYGDTDSNMGVGK